MTDLYDRATEREEEMRADALDEVLRRLPNGPEERFCQVCGEPIPDARRAALPGVPTCVECQTDLERGLRPWEDCQ